MATAILCLAGFCLLVKFSMGTWKLFNFCKESIAFYAGQKKAVKTATP